MYKKFLFWIPRIIMIVIIGLFILLDFGVFSEDWMWYEKLVGFIIQLIPVVIMIAVLVLFWKQSQKKALIASVLFFVITLVFLFFFKLYQDIISFLIIGLPILLVSVLFFLDYIRIKKQGII